MAKGYPDFFGFSMFPFYGSLLDDMSIGVLSAGETDDVTSISGKNHIFGGYARLFNVADPTDLNIKIITDSVTIQDFSYQALLGAQESNKPYAAGVVTLASYEAALIVIRFLGGFTVEDEYIIRMKNNGAYSMNGAGELYYSPIVD